MNTTNSNLEPGWATYLKTAAIILPGVLVWVGSMTFIVPKLKEICIASGTVFPKPFLTVLDLSVFLRNNFIVESVVVFAALILLEWRSRRWPRYRRLVFGIVAYSLNFIALALIATLFFLAVLAGTNLLPPR